MISSDERAAAPLVMGGQGKSSEELAAIVLAAVPYVLGAAALVACWACWWLAKGGPK